MSAFFFVISYGHIYVAALLAVSAVAGGAMVWRGLRPGRRSWVVAGALVLGVATCVAYAAFDARANVMWRPPIAGAESLLGHWSGDGGTLTLLPDGRYLCGGQGQCPLLAGDGRWTRERQSGDVILWPPAVAPRRYVILAYRGHLRLTDFVVDTDAWDGRFAFSQDRLRHD